MERIIACNRFTTQHVRASCSVLKIPLSPYALCGPVSVAVCYFCGRLYECVIQDKLLSLNNAVVVTNVLAAVLRDTFSCAVRLIPLFLYTYSGVLLIDPDNHLFLMSLHLVSPDLLSWPSPWPCGSFHLTWTPSTFCSVAYWLEYRWKIKKHMLELPSPCVLSLRTAHWLITPKCSAQPAGLFVVIASVWRSANK